MTLKERAKTEVLRENVKPKRWYYAIPIVLIWALLIFVIVKAIIM